jgi:WD40 repeat protein
LVAAAVLLGAPSAAYGQQRPSSEPILRVETGMHTAPIVRAAADAAGRIFATASADKTVRLWSLADGPASSLTSRSRISSRCGSNSPTRGGCAGQAVPKPSAWRAALSVR